MSLSGKKTQKLLKIRFPFLPKTQTIEAAYQSFHITRKNYSSISYIFEKLSNLTTSDFHISPLFW